MTPLIRESRWSAASSEASRPKASQGSPWADAALGPPDQLMRSAGAYRRLIEREIARLPARPGASAPR